MSEKWHELLLNYMEQELERAQDSKNIDKRVSEDYFKFCDLIRKAITISNTIHYKSEDHPELIIEYNENNQYMPMIDEKNKEVQVYEGANFEEDPFIMNGDDSIYLDSDFRKEYYFKIIQPKFNY